LTKEERVDLVDEKDRVIGSANLGECLERGFLHRAIAVVVSRTDARIVLQQRSKKDEWHPGRWTLSCTGHVKRGEPYLVAAERELAEEIGIVAELALVGKYLIPPMKEKGLTEHEWVTLFTAVSDDSLTIDPVELEGAKEFTLSEVRRLLHGGTLTPDSVMLLAEYLRRSR
jgi:isopentenyl-diphosphate Delta-isomerase